jgi:hypothetical protein
MACQQLIDQLNINLESTMLLVLEINQLTLGHSTSVSKNGVSRSKHVPKPGDTLRNRQ